MSRPPTKNTAILATYLLSFATERQGITVNQLAEEFPAIGRSTIYRIIKKHPAFREALSPFHPRGYWYDPNKANKDSKAPVGNNLSIDIRPELIPTDRKRPGDWLGVCQKHMRANVDFDNQSPIYKAYCNLLGASNNSLAFQTNTEQLDPVGWKEAQQSIDSLQQFALILYTRLEHIRSDPRYDTPEWWALFPKE